MLSAYQQIRSLCSTIRHQESNLCEQLKRARNHSEDSLETSSSSSSSHVEEISSLQIGLLNDSVLELKGLCHSLMQNSKNCPFCSSSGATALEHQQKLQTSQHQSEMMTLALKQKESQLKKKDEEIVSLQSQVRIIPICQFPHIFCFLHSLEVINLITMLIWPDMNSLLSLAKQLGQHICIVHIMTKGFQIRKQGGGEEKQKNTK